MIKFSVMDWVALILVIMGGINWGLIGFFNFNLLGTILSHAPFVEKIMYSLMGLAAVWIIVKLSRSKNVGEA